MKTKAIFLIFISFTFVEANAQSNWIINNFKSYLSNGLTSEYIDKSEDLINQMSGYEREKSFYALSLFKMMTNYSNERMPICQFNIAKSAVGISFSSKYLNGDVSLLYCNINGEYYYFLNNTLKKNGVDVGLSGVFNNYSTGGRTTSSVNCGALPYSVAFFGKNKSYLDYSIVSFRKTISFSESPCN